MHSRAGACVRAKLFPAVFVAAIVFTSGAAFACGYHNPSDVARGVMNFAYPKSLYVRTAVWQAQNSGLLPARRLSPTETNKKVVTESGGA